MRFSGSDLDRRRLMKLSLLAALPGLLPFAEIGSALADDTSAAGGAGSHDFDFFLGQWKVRHRRLKVRLANNDEWEEFDGTTNCISLLGGIANLNDSIVHRPGGTYRGMGIRAFDAKNGRWGDWYLDGRNPTSIEVHGIGRFENGIATFFADDTFDGKPVKVRGTWSHITRDSFQWAQAFSPDGGTTWETNYVMHQTRCRTLSRATL